MRPHLQRLVWGLFPSLVVALPHAALPLSIPITVQELAPPGAPVFPHAPEVVAVGVPLAIEDNITDTSQLGFEGADAAQFRVLQRHLDSNAIRWVLVSFVADGPGSAYRVVNGSGNFGGPSLGTDLGDRIVVSTGAATFEVRKLGFNLLDRVLVDSGEIVAPHADGGIVMAQGATLFTSANDASSQTFLEENGPVRAVICSKGLLRDAGGVRHCAYTARLHFYKGQSRCRAFITLRNADIAATVARTFDAAWVELPMATSGTHTLSFGLGDGSTQSSALDPGGSAFLFQGDNVHYRSARTDRILPYLTATRGLEIEIAGAELKSAGSVGDFSRGWMRVQGNDTAILAGMRDMATLFPSGFDVQNDRLSVELFSRHNPKRGLVFSWGAHETREIVFEFGTPTGLDTAKFEAGLNTPLFGRCDFEQYRSTGAIYGETRLVTVSEERDFFAALGRNWTLNDFNVNQIELDRQYTFSTTGGPNQFDRDMTYLLDFLRSGQSGRFEEARLSVQWKADQAVEHSDDFDYGLRQNGITDVDVEQPEGFHGIGAGSRYDDEHPHWDSLPIYYLMTGDERVREAIEDYAEWRRYRGGNPIYGAFNGGAIGHFRLWSRAFRDAAWAWEFTRQPRYLADLRTMATVLTRTIETGNSRGRNLQRGYFYFGEENDASRRIHLFFLTEMNGPATQEAMRVLPPNDPLREELRDYMAGLAWFTLREAQISRSAIGYPYGYFSAYANTELGTRGDQTGMLLTHGYEQSGDVEFIDRARAFAWRVLEYQSPLRGSELSTHVRIYRWLHQSETGAVLIEPAAYRNADGSYTLEWTARVDSRAYIVKYGPRRMVENLGFDQATRRYDHDPATTMNFWAATNLSGEGAPSPPGTVESFRTPVLPPGDWHFAVKVLLGSAGQTVPVAIDVRNFEAQALESGNVLWWSLPAEAVPMVSGIRVDRSTSHQGPWIERTTEPMAPSTEMSFTDSSVEPGVAYWYRLRLFDEAGAVTTTHAVQVSVAGAAGPATVFRAAVEPSGPGPIQLHYAVGRTRQRVRFEIFNARGQAVRVLDQGWHEPGEHTATWDRRDHAGHNVTRGVYLVRMHSDARPSVQKLVIKHR